MDIKNYNDVLNLRANRIIIKRLEPYDVIESAKKFYDTTDYTFNGRNKFEQLNLFLNDLSEAAKQTPTMGLYMKNVNKFYLLKIKQNPENLTDIELLHKLLISQEYGFSEESQINRTEILYSADTYTALEMIDTGKAEASFILNL